MNYVRTMGIFIFALSTINPVMHAATLLVTNLLDNGSSGSLREVIVGASSGDTIKFSVTGTIFLDDVLGVLTVSKNLIIDGENKITIDGQNQLNIGIQISTSNANNTEIKNITIQNFAGSQSAVGILLDQFASNCSVTNTTIMNITSGSDNAFESYAGGVLSSISPGTWEPFKDIVGNTIVNVTSSDNFAGNTGFAVGIGVDAITGMCSNNVVENIRSGNALGDSAFTNFTAGISVGLLSSCIGNHVSNIKSGDAHNSSLVVGILGGHITGECSNNYITNIASGAANNVSGDAAGIVVAGSASGDCSDNSISNIFSGDAYNTGAVYGIATAFFGPAPLQGNCSNNLITMLSSGAAQNNSGIVSGLDMHAISGNCTCNRINSLSSGAANNNAGSVSGIFERVALEGDLVGNTVKNIYAGSHNNNAAHVVGIYANKVSGNCSYNCVADLASLGGIFSDYIGGIRLREVEDQQIVEYNNIENLIADNNSVVFGIHIEEGLGLKIHNNTISSIAGGQQGAHGFVLGNNESSGNIVEDSVVCTNSVFNITGNNSNGYGVTILGNQSQSVGNSLLSNSIFSVNGKAVNIADNGVPTDGTVLLTSVGCGANKIVVAGTLFPSLGFEQSEFLLQFFTNDSNDPSQAKTLLGEASVLADGVTLFIKQVPLCTSINQNQFVTATATVLASSPQSEGENNNTSEVSNSVLGCNNLAFCPVH